MVPVVLFLGHIVQTSFQGLQPGKPAKQQVIPGPCAPVCPFPFFPHKIKREKKEGGRKERGGSIHELPLSPGQTK